MTFGAILFCIFLVLKLCGVIAWSWWWVTCPLWAGIAFAICMLVFGASLAALVALVVKVFSRKR